MTRARVMAVCLGVSLALGVGLVPTGARVAYADGAADKKKAKAHFKQGQEFQKVGAWDQAIEEYQAAYALAPLPQILFNIGLCYKEKGDKPQAVDYFRRFLDAVPEGDASDEAREYVAVLVRQLDEEKAAAAEQKRKEDQAAADAEKKRKEDQAAADAEAKRKQEQAAADEERKRKEAEAAAAEKQRLADEAERKKNGLPPVEQKQPPPPPPPQVGETQAPPPPRPRKVKRGGGTLRGLGVASFVVGLGGIGAGVYFGLDAQKIEREVEGATGAWTDELEARSKAGDTAQSRMYLCYGVASALVLGGAVMYGLGVAAETEIVITPQQAFVGLRGRF